MPLTLACCDWSRAVARPEWGAPGDLPENPKPLQRTEPGSDDENSRVFQGRAALPDFLCHPTRESGPRALLSPECAPRRRGSAGRQKGLAVFREYKPDLVPRSKRLPAVFRECGRKWACLR